MAGTRNLLWFDRVSHLLRVRDYFAQHRRMASLALAAILPLSVVACGDVGNASSAPVNTSSSSTTTLPPTTPALTIPAHPTPALTIAPRLPPATQAEKSLLHDLYNLKMAEQTASSSVTAMTGNQGAYSLRQVSSRAALVTSDLTLAIKQLAAVIPTLRANAVLTKIAEPLTRNLTGDLQGFNSEAASVHTDASAAQLPGISPSMASAESALTVGEAVNGYAQGLGLVNETFSVGLVADFVKVLSMVVEVPTGIAISLSQSLNHLLRTLSEG